MYLKVLDRSRRHDTLYNEQGSLGYQPPTMVEGHIHVGGDEKLRFQRRFLYTLHQVSSTPSEGLQSPHCSWTRSNN